MDKLVRIRAAGLIVVALLLLACEPSVRNRPYGYERIGPVKNFLAAETDLPSNWLIFRRDAGGLSTMSTLCSRDLYPLRLIDREDHQVYHCDKCGSEFSKFGKTIHGPAIEELPYYALQIDQAVVQGPKDELYAIVGKKVSPDWRLVIK